MSLGGFGLGEVLPVEVELQDRDEDVAHLSSEKKVCFL